MLNRVGGVLNCADKAAHDDSGRRTGVANVALRFQLWAPTLLFAVMSWQWRWIHDDGFINFRVVANTAAGHGPVFNIGQRVEAFTSPAWIAVLTLGKALTFGVVSIETLSIIVGIALGTIGVALATDRSASGIAAGPWCIAALPIMWTWSTAGLEGGLILAWLGWIVWKLRAQQRMMPAKSAETRHGPGFGLGLVLGLGPLIRPELALIAVLVAWWKRRDSALSTGALLAGVAAPTAVYTCFRAGYFAALLPNSALAKSVGGFELANGLHYVAQTLRAHWLLVPLAAGCYLLAASRISQRSAGDRTIGQPQTVPACTDPACTASTDPTSTASADPARTASTDHASAATAGTRLAILSLVYLVEVVFIGGDYMYGRMMMPALFLAFSAIPNVGCSARTVHLDPRRSTFHKLTAQRLAMAAMLGWCVLSATVIRFDVADAVSPHGFRAYDQRDQTVSGTGVRNPVHIADFERHFIWLSLNPSAERARRQGDVLIVSAVQDPVERGGTATFPMDRPATPRSPHGAVYVPAIGVIGYAYADLTVVDAHGLADPIASRMAEPWFSTGIAGHRRSLPVAWAVAEWAPSEATEPNGVNDEEAAHEALQCGALRRLLHDIEAPLSANVVAANIWHSFANTRLTIPRNPFAAHATFCNDRRNDRHNHDEER